MSYIFNWVCVCSVKYINIEKMCIAVTPVSWICVSGCDCSYEEKFSLNFLDKEIRNITHPYNVDITSCQDSDMAFWHWFLTHFASEMYCSH